MTVKMNAKVVHRQPLGKLSGMRLSHVASVDAESPEPLFVMFHGYGNDETEMARIVESIYDGTGRQPDYLSFRGPATRPYLGGAYWYPDGCGVPERP